MNIKILRPVWVEVDLDIIRHNFREIRKCVGSKTKIGSVVKANGYGHGAIEVARVLEEENTDYICVAGLDEAIELRHAGIKSKLLVMGYIPTEHFNIAIENDISITIFSKKQADLLSNIAEEMKKIATIHIKIETGFNRLGFEIDDKLKNTIEDIYRLKNVYVEGIFSHLALKDKKSDKDQMDKFKSLLDEIDYVGIPIKHMCDSIGMVAYEDFHMDMVRVGASLYGYNSRETTMDLKPAMAFKAKLSMIKNIKKGEGISYDYTFVADKDMKIGTVTCGYSDGIPRLLSNKGYAYINGKKANILGKMCMDQCMVDLTDISNVDENSEVIFYGKDGPALLDIANLANTNRNEILSLVSRRVSRIYMKEKKVYKILNYLN